MDDLRAIDLSGRPVDENDRVAGRSSEHDPLRSPRFDATSLLPGIHRQVAAMLAGVIGSAETLSTAGLSPHHRRLLDDIVLRLSAARRLVGDAAIISQVPISTESLEAESISARTLVDRVIGSRRRTARTARVEVSNQVPMSLATIDIDVTIASRLIGRAIDGLIPGSAPGVILVQGVLERDDQLKIRIVRSSIGGDPSGVEGDDGDSILSPADARLFEIESTLLGIRIQPLENAPGRRGFDLLIPLADAGTRESTKMDRAVADESVHRPSVLVAEDARVNQIVARAMLERLGCDVVLVADGVAALEALGTRRFDLVFMDCNMPKMDGFETVAAIRSRGGSCATLPIIALTASSQDGAREECLAKGMDDFLAKPLRLDTLRRLLERYSLIAS